MLEPVLLCWTGVCTLCHKTSWTNSVIWLVLDLNPKKYNLAKHTTVFFIIWSGLDPKFVISPQVCAQESAQTSLAHQWILCSE